MSAELVDIYLDEELLLFAVRIVGSDHCGVCQREIEPEDARLTFRLIVGDHEEEVEVCRACLSEHYPALAEALDQVDWESAG